MKSEDFDTDTLLVMLRSLLDGLEVSDQDLLVALTTADGDIHLAASSIRQGSSSSKRAGDASTKRKESLSVAQWLKSPYEPESSRKRQRVEPEILYVSDSSDSHDVLKSKMQSPESLSVSARPAKNLNEVLRSPPNIRPSAPRLRPMTLGTPDIVAKHTPTTMHYSVLPPELACRLFFTMLEEAEGWRRSKWYLVDRMVESPHLTSFYVRDHSDMQWDDSARYWYNGVEKPFRFPAALEEACRHVEKVVNAELAKRERFPLEWGGDSGWKANVAAANRYKGAREGVGFHADQLTNLGPYPTIASLSLGTERIFRLRETIPKPEQETRAARTYNIPLPHNSLLIMHGGCQEHFKHTIPIIPSAGIDVYKPLFPKEGSHADTAYNERINVTFRFYRPDFAVKTIMKCKCPKPLPMVLRAQQKARGRLSDGGDMRYIWMCGAAPMNDGQSCGYVKVLDMVEEGRGPILGDVQASAEHDPDP